MSEFSEAATPKHSYTNPSKKHDLAHLEADGKLIKRPLIVDPKVAKQHVLKMVSNQAINCLSGKQIPCEIDSVCVHGDGKSSVNTAKQIKLGLKESGVTLKPLDKMEKFI